MAQWLVSVLQWSGGAAGCLGMVHVLLMLPAQQMPDMLACLSGAEHTRGRASSRFMPCHVLLLLRLVCPQVSDCKKSGGQLLEGGQGPQVPRPP